MSKECIHFFVPLCIRILNSVTSAYLITMVHLWRKQLQEHNFVTLQEAMSVPFVFVN